MKMKKNILGMLLAATAAVCAPVAVCSAAYVTAYEQHVDEKYVVDTSTVYRPDADHINVGVYYTDNIKQKTYPYVYKFWYNSGRGAWYILEQKDKAESGDIYEDDTHYWSIVEEKSIAQDVLKVVLAYTSAD
ncbi:hypothetical protein [Mitsuokella sp.]|uniref:hypothetical protein n=1 Tax=unclassified Mitsuokella TaxID=2637239 RepID=UPI003D7D4689